MLVTGAGGRLGRLLRRACARDGSGGMAVTFQSRRPGTGLAWAPGDPLSHLPRAGTVLALWGRTEGTQDELAENAALVGTSQAVARACGARRLFHVSSAAVYGRGAGLREETPLAPLSDYGRAKRAMEQAVFRLPAEDGIAHCCLRLSNVVGADSLAPGLTAEAPVPVDRFDDGTGPMRSYIAASDLLRVVLALAARPPEELPRLLNVAAPRPLRMEDLLREAGRDIAWRPAPDSAVQAVTLDTGRLSRQLPDLAMLSTAKGQIADWKELEATA